MNKYQEAYKRISKDDYSSYHGVNNAKKRQKDFDLIKRLVDKATPKKPCFDKLYKDEETTSIYDENGWIDPILCICPNCGKKAIHDFEYDENFKHCTNCGQAIDWSDEE
ncbi:MAG: hypothetical protein ACLRT4_18215 [Thomasclavelia sp.]